MTALSADRNTREAAGQVYSGPAAAAVKCYAGAMLVRDSSGNIKPAVTATGLVVAGRCEKYVDNTDGAAADVDVTYKAGIFRWANSAAADEITKASIGDNCFIVDDQTVAKTDGTGTRSVAGKIVDVDDNGVWVETGIAVTQALAGGLLAANNLSDVGSKPTSRTNLGVYEKLGTPGFTIGAEAGNVINVGIQLNDSLAAALAVRGSLTAYLSDDANGESIAATAPSGGWAIGTDGVLIPLIAGKAAQLVSESDGDIDINITEAGADTWYLVLVMPDGKLVVSDAITFA